MLALKTDFCLEESYKLFDTASNGVINFRELEETYNFYNIYPLREEIELIMRKYDQD